MYKVLNTVTVTTHNTLVSGDWLQLELEFRSTAVVGHRLLQLALAEALDGAEQGSSAGTALAWGRSLAGLRGWGWG